jgi:hypothetical protein
MSGRDFLIAFEREL